VESKILDVFIYASITAIATGFGALPFAFVKSFPRNWLGIGNAIAAGLMLAASFGLIYEGVNESLLRTMVGVIVGLVFILWSHHFLEKYEDLDIGDLSGLDARKALLIVGVMTLHSFAEGVGVGVSFGGGIAFGLFVTIAIAVHNIPEGLAISLVLVPRGVAWWKAALWAIFSSLPQPGAGVYVRRKFSPDPARRSWFRCRGDDLDGILGADPRRPGRHRRRRGGHHDRAGQRRHGQLSGTAGRLARQDLFGIQGDRQLFVGRDYPNLNLASVARDARTAGAVSLFV